MPPNARRLLLVTRLLLGGVFAVTGAIKAYALLTDAPSPDTIFGALAASSLPAAWAIVAIEMVLGAAMLAGYHLLLTSAVAIVFLAAATGVLVREYQQPAPRACGCANPIATTSAPGKARADLGQGILLNGLLLCSTTPLLLASARRARPDVQAPTWRVAA